MNKRAFARNLALSLSSLRWTQEEIERCLSRRLPPQAQKLVPGLAGALVAQHAKAYSPSPGRATQILSGSEVFDRLYRQCRKKDYWPDLPDETRSMMPIRAFVDLSLPQLLSEADVADWLLLPLERLLYFADPHGFTASSLEPAVTHYVTHFLDKKSGRKRLIEAPKTSLKAIQCRIKSQILDHIPQHPSAFGFIAGKNCCQAAQKHAGEAAVLSLDIRDFFANVGRARVYAQFRCFGYPHGVADCLANLCTTSTQPDIATQFEWHSAKTLMSRHLPQGAPSSPALANLAAYRLDCRLAGLAARFDLTYTRYADDLAFSGDETGVRAVAASTPKIVAAEGFSVNPEKTRQQLAHQRQVVTGLVVNQHLNIRRRDFDLLKAEIHALKRNTGLIRIDPAALSRLDGRIAWVEQVNLRRGTKLRRSLNQVIAGQEL
ncbi:MAG: RNA-directed DNA polymerase [Rhodobacteraceae bacterium]|nr:RNA-directed DNA polymerase [Paracoccaceae bacterium]